MTIAELYAYLGSLLAGRLVSGEEPCVVRFGEVKAAEFDPPILALMTADSRRGYYDKHTDATAVTVLQFREPCPLIPDCCPTTRQSGE